MRKFRKPPSLRFWEKVSKDEECWLWNGARNRDGYGEFCLEGRNISSHRYSWILHYGDIPNGLQVLHKCDNAPCVNPEHLFTGTQLDNMIDMDRKGRSCHPNGENTYNARLISKQVQEIRESTLFLRELAEIYGVCMSHISRIKRGKKWRHLEIKANQVGGND